MNNLDPKTFFFELPIYTSIKITGENEQDLLFLLTKDERINYYNPTLGENSTYTRAATERGHALYFIQAGGIRSFTLTCVRTSEHFTFFTHYDAVNKLLMKIGQYPSVAHFHIARIKQYNKVLSKERLGEFTRAIGLAANGVGIGSFVYLRRIFEDLIEEAHTKASIEQGWAEEQYSKSRMADRIELIKAYLPPFLVENKGLYGILSKGIHSLKEDECLAYFETVKVGIELILDEKLEAFEKQRKVEEARQKLAALQSKIK